MASAGRCLPLWTLRRGIHVRWLPLINLREYISSFAAWRSRDAIFRISLPTISFILIHTTPGYTCSYLSPPPVHHWWCDSCRGLPRRWLSPKDCEHMGPWCSDKHISLLIRSYLLPLPARRLHTWLPLLSFATLWSIACWRRRVVSRREARNLLSLAWWAILSPRGRENSGGGYNREGGFDYLEILKVHHGEHGGRGAYCLLNSSHQRTLCCLCDGSLGLRQCRLPQLTFHNVCCGECSRSSYQLLSETCFDSSWHVWACRSVVWGSSPGSSGFLSSLATEEPHETVEVQEYPSCVEEVEGGTLYSL